MLHCFKWRHTLVSLVLFIVSAFLADVYAQHTEPGQFSLSAKGGFSFYNGDLDSRLTPVFGQVNGSSLGGAFELGYHLTDFLGFGAAYHLANYPRVALNPQDAAFYTLRHSAQLLMRFTDPTISQHLAPYAHLGLHVTSGARIPPNLSPTGREQDPIAVGPILGIGMDVPLSRNMVIFAEASGKFSFPDRAFDALDTSGNGYDFFGFFGTGLRVRFGGEAAPLIVRAAGPTELEVHQIGTYTAVVEDRNGPNILYEWDFGDGNRTWGETVSHSFEEPGTYTVTVEASRQRRLGEARITVTATPATADETPVDEPVADLQPTPTVSPECQAALDDAEALYQGGQFDSAIETVSICLDQENLRRDIAIRAYRLRSLAHSSDGNVEAAKESIGRILDISPSYQPDPVQDPPSYQTLVEAVRDERRISSESQLEAPSTPQRESFISPDVVLEYSSELQLSSTQIAELRAVAEVIDDIEAPLLSSLASREGDLDTQISEEERRQTAEEISRIQRQLRALYQNGQHQVMQILSPTQARQLVTFRNGGQ